MAEPRFWARDDNHAVATLGPLIITLWRGDRTYENWRVESTPVFKHVELTSPKGGCVLVVAEATAKSPSSEARDEVNALAKVRQAFVVSSAILVYGSAARVASTRAMVAAINVFSKGNLRVYTEPEKAFESLIASGRAAGVSFDVSQASILLKKMREPT